LGNWAVEQYPNYLVFRPFFISTLMWIIKQYVIIHLIQKTTQTVTYATYNEKNLSQLFWILFGWILLRWLPDWKTYEDGTTLFIRVDNLL